MNCEYLWYSWVYFPPVQAAKEAKDDDGAFVYALPENHGDPTGRYHPYNLKVVSPHKARAQTVYYMGSATSVTRVCSYNLILSLLGYDKTVVCLSVCLFVRLYITSLVKARILFILYTQNPQEV